jgi:biotin-(acetyl-CoA carboxylase) ligase
VAEAVEEAMGLAVQVKWPNDVMLNRRKVAGSSPRQPTASSSWA